MEPVAVEVLDVGPILKTLIVASARVIAGKALGGRAIGPIFLQLTAVSQTISLSATEYYK